MKIAVATLEKTPDSEISMQAGRAPYYLIFEKGNFLEAWENPFARGGGGAGFAVSRVMQEKGVNAVIAGKFGENMISSLDSAGIKHYEKNGIAKDIVKEIDSE